MLYSFTECCAAIFLTTTNLENRICLGRIVLCMKISSVSQEITLYVSLRSYISLDIMRYFI